MRIVVLSIYLILSFTLQVLAQDSQHIGPSLVSSLNDFNEINNAKIQNKCPDLPDQKKINNAVVDCECDHPNELDKEDYKNFQINDVKLEDLPEGMKSFLPGRAFEMGHGGVKVVVSLPNDNKALGLWGVIFGDDGDDFGSTHGTGINFTKTNKRGITYTLDAQTNLYTKRNSGAWFKKNGDKMYSQYFTNENLINFTIDNIYKDKVLYWKAGVGWIQLDSENSDGIIQASKQQSVWHKFLDIYNFEYEKDGTGVKNGANLDFFMGIQKNLMLGSSCRVRFYGESGAHISTLNDDYFKIEAGSTLYYQKEGKGFNGTLGLSTNAKAHSEGIQTQSDISLGLNGKRSGVEFIYHVKSGDLRNHVKYNLVNQGTGKIDPTFSMKFKYIFGQSKNRKKSTR